MTKSFEDHHGPPRRALKYVLFVPDGAADLHRADGLSPLAGADMPNADLIAARGYSGLMQTLYPDLPKESMVAQLGMLGWCPHRFYPHGRASCELLALEGAHLDERDLACRANLVRMSGGVLVSYSANFIESRVARPLIDKINRSLAAQYPEFEIYHNSDFRNTLVVRDAGCDPRDLSFPEPHENQGVEFRIAKLVTCKDERCRPLARRINEYLVAVHRILEGEAANALFPWSASRPFRLNSFQEQNNYDRPTAVIGFMDFLKGIARAGSLDFLQVGNGRPDTDYKGKGEAVVELLRSGYELLICHVNAPDEASHLGDRALKIACLEAFDREVVGPTVRFFEDRINELGGVMIAPDHYTNHSLEENDTRIDAHSMEPVPVSIWNGRDRDRVRKYSEDDARRGRLGVHPFSHLELLRVLGVSTVPARQEGVKEHAWEPHHAHV